MHSRPAVFIRFVLGLTVASTANQDVEVATKPLALEAATANAVASKASWRKADNGTAAALLAERRGFYSYGNAGLAQKSAKGWPPPPESWGVLQNATFTAFAITVGYKRQRRLQAAVLVVVAFLIMVAGTITATVVAKKNPELVPAFAQSGTMGYVCRDAGTPQGRLWMVALLITPTLLITSQYPFMIYKPWAPWVVRKENPLLDPAFAPVGEYLWRMVWAVFPNVCWIVKSAIPHGAGERGYQFEMTFVHDICGVMALIFCITMETWQLGFGENAFAYLFSTEATPVFGSPLSLAQRLRALMCILAWFSGAGFVCLQLFFHMFPNRSYKIAYVCYCFEVWTLVFVFALPCVAGIDYFAHQEAGSVIEDTKRIIGTWIEANVPNP